MSVEIGALIKLESKNQGLSPKQFGELINRHEKTIANIFKRKTIDTMLLLTISKALKHDFFQYYYNEEPLKSLRKAEMDSIYAEISSLREKLDEKLNYITIQDAFVASQKEVIQLLKEKEKNLKK